MTRTMSTENRTALFRTGSNFRVHLVAPLQSDCGYCSYSVPSRTVLGPSKTNGFVGAANPHPFIRIVRVSLSSDYLRSEPMALLQAIERPGGSTGLLLYSAF